VGPGSHADLLVTAEIELPWASDVVYLRLTLEALSPLSGVWAARSFDPDPDALWGLYASDNQILDELVVGGGVSEAKAMALTAAGGVGGGCSGLGDLDADDGEALSTPEPWSDPAVPPSGAGEPGVRSLPFGVVAGGPRYVVVDQPTVPDGRALGASGPVSWIAALDDVDDAVAGLEAADHAAIMDALREHLHHDPYLVYDPSDAASSDDEGSYITWDWISVDLGDWLDRNDGVGLSCHSLACVYSSLGNHLGLPTEYVTLGTGFTTNLARAAGTDTWARYGFSSQGIVTVDGGETVWDAAVDRDGDADPASQPVSEVSPMGWSLDDYLDALTPDLIGVVNGGRCYVY